MPPWWPLLKPLPWNPLALVMSLHSFEDRSISQIPQCIKQISHHAPFCNRNVHTCTFLLQNGALWDMGLLHCGIWATGLLRSCLPIWMMLSDQWEYIWNNLQTKHIWHCIVRIVTIIMIGIIYSCFAIFRNIHFICSVVYLIIFYSMPSQIVILMTYIYRNTFKFVDGIISTWSV